MEVFFWIMVAFMFAAGSYALAPDGKKELAAIFGLLFGPFGLLVALFIKKD